LPHSILRHVLEAPFLLKSTNNWGRGRGEFRRMRGGARWRCMQAGHVFVHTRNLKNAGQFLTSSTTLPTFVFPDNFPANHAGVGLGVFLASRQKGGLWCIPGVFHDSGQKGGRLQGVFLGSGKKGWGCRPEVFLGIRQKGVHVQVCRGAP